MRDDSYDADGIAALFTEDATWDSPGLGRFEDRDAIRDFFRGAAGIFSFAIHYSSNLHGWRYGAGAVVPAYAVPGRRRKSRHVARQHRP